MPSVDLNALCAALPPETRDQPPSIPSKVAIFESKRLFDTLNPHRDRFLKLPDFAIDNLDHLPTLAEFAEGAEREWIKAKVATPQSPAATLRKSAEELKSNLLAAGRYLLRKNEQVQGRLDEITDGDNSIPDLVDDLRKHAALVDEFPDRYAVDTRLPKDAAKLARDYADKLTGAKDTSAANQALAHRNQVAWVLHNAVSEVRAAGRYLFRDDPKMLAAIASDYVNAKARKSRKNKGTKEEPSPE